VILLIRLAGVGGGTFSPPASAQGHGYSQRVRELLDYGYAATQAQQWNLAIRYYGDAQKELPHDPAILLSLGLANAKAGKPLASILWFRASLAAGQSPADIPKIEEKIKLQEIVARAAMQAFIDEAVKAGFPSNSNDISFLAFDLRKSGDIQGALEVMKLTPNPSPSNPKDVRNFVDDYEAIAEAALEDGDETRAESALQSSETEVEKISDQRKKVSKLMSIASMYEALAKAALKDGDKTRAESVLRRAETQAEKINDQGKKARMLVSIASLWQEAGKTEQSAPILLAASNAEAQDYDLMLSIAKVELRAQHQKAAQAALKAYVSGCVESGKDYEVIGAIREQAKAGDFSGAQQTIKALKDSLQIMEALQIIAAEELRHGDAELARLTINEYEKTAMGKPDPRDLIEFAKLEIQGHDLVSARRHLALALAAAKSYGADDFARIYVDSTLEISTLYEAMGNRTEARATLNELLTDGEKNLSTHLKSFVDKQQLSNEEFIQLLEMTSETESKLGETSGARRMIDVMKALSAPSYEMHPGPLTGAIARALAELAKAQALSENISIARQLLTEMRDCDVQFATSVDLAKLETERGRSSIARSILSESETSDWLDWLDSPTSDCNRLALRLKIQPAFDPREYRNQIAVERPAKFSEALIKGVAEISSVLGYIRQTELKWSKAKASFPGR
jgi:hypothetical protein